MSFIIAVALISVWISATSGITLGPSTGPPNTFNKPSPYIVTTAKNVWRNGTTCEIIFNTDPSNPTGYYLILDPPHGIIRLMYCDMSQIMINPGGGSPGGKPGGNPGTKHKNMRLCGEDGPWTKMGYLDMSDSRQTCPSNWQEYNTGGIRTCQRSVHSCDSVIIHNLNGTQYTEICGRVVGYQYGKTNAVSQNAQIQYVNINTIMWMVLV